MRIRRLLVVSAATVVISSLVSSGAAVGQDRPLVLVFPVPIEERDKQVSNDPDVVAAVVSLLGEGGQAEALVFSPELPMIARAVLEGKLREDTLKQWSDPRRAVEIARAVGAAYALRMQGAIVDRRVGVVLELLNVPAGGKWVASAESEVAEGGSMVEGINRRNAIRTAASAAVSQITIMALGGVSAQPLDKSSEYTTTATGPKKPEPKARDIQAELDGSTLRGDQYAQKGDLANAVQEYRKAVNLDPTKASSRVKLAAAYSQLGMVQEAIGECRRALLFNKDDVSIYSALLKYCLAAGAIEEASNQCREIVRLDPSNAQVRLNLGDMYWNQGKTEEAANSYEEAAELDPENPMPHERLYKLYVARKMHALALEHLLRARQAAQSGDQRDVELYVIFAEVVQDQFNSVVGKLRAAGDDLKRQRMTREDYYSECKDIGSQADGLAGFVSGQSAAAQYKQAHSHGLLAVSLLAQSTGSLILYLETENGKYADDAEILEAEAKAELALFTRAVRGG